MAGLPAGLVAASSARSSWAARSARAASTTQYPPRHYYRAPYHCDTRFRLFVHLTNWSRCFHTPELNDSRRSYGYKTLYCSSYEKCPIWHRTHVCVWTRDRCYIGSCTPSEEHSLFSSDCFVQVILILYTVQDGTHCPSARARPQVFLLPGKPVSEMRFIAVLGKVHLHCCCFIVVRHGGHVHVDVFFFLFLRLATTHSFSNLFPLPLMSHLIPYPGYHGDTIMMASVALGLMNTHSSR